jgi:hypothetical protein
LQIQIFLYFRETGHKALLDDVRGVDLHALSEFCLCRDVVLGRERHFHVVRGAKVGIVLLSLN